MTCRPTCKPKEDNITYHNDDTIYFIDCPTAYFDGRWRVLIIYGWVKWQVRENLFDGQLFLYNKYSLNRQLFFRSAKNFSVQITYRIWMVNWSTWHEWTWDKEKIWVSDSNQTHDLLNTRWELYPLSTHLVFGRSWVQLLSGTQIFSLSQPCVMLINSPFTFCYRA